MAIDVDLKNIDVYDGIAIGSDRKISGIKNGELRPLVGDNSILFKNADSKRKKPLSGGLLSNEYLHINSGSILAPYQHVLAVDTNTKGDFIEGNKVSVSTMIHCIVDSRGQDGMHIRYSLVGAWEFWNLDDRCEESHFWWFLISSIEFGNADEIYKEGKVAILTDCDQANHAAFNKREKPIFKGYFLPERYTVIFATADSARDFSNKVVRKCDRFSDLVMRHLKDFPQPERVYEKDFTHFRRWLPNDDESWEIVP